MGMRQTETIVGVSNGNAPSMLSKYIRGVLTAKDVEKAGEQYAFLKSQLVETEENHLQYLNSLATCVTAFKKEHSDIVQVVLSHSLSSSEEHFIAFKSFVLNLVSARTHFLPQCLMKLVEKLLPWELETEEGVPTTFAAEDVMELTFSRVISLVVEMLAVVPSASTAIIPVVQDTFPYMTRHMEYQKHYLKNILALARAAPSLQNGIVGAAVDRIIQIDVEIKLELFEEDEVDGVFAVDLDDERERERQENIELATKLDTMMMLMFGFLDEQSKELESRESLWELLLLIFDASIVRTHKSKYTQFLLFRMCRLDEQYASTFLDYLIGTVCSPSSDIAHRVSCAAYVGSFVARARYLPTNLAKVAVLQLCEWLQNYETQKRGAAVAERHPVFYAVCQTVFYIVCFLQDTLLDNEGFVRKLGMDRIVQGPLNPLRVCLPTVVNEFARIMCDRELGFYIPIIEQNSRSAPCTPIDAFFPFDPYLLKYSHTFIDDLYRDWQGEEDDGTDSSDEDEDDDEEGLGELAMGTSANRAMLPRRMTPDTPGFFFRSPPQGVPVDGATKMSWA